MAFKTDISTQRQADVIALATFKQLVLDFIRQFEQGSPTLLRYVGLLPD